MPNKIECFGSMHHHNRTFLLALVVSLLPLFNLFSQATLTALTVPGAIADGGGTGSTGTPYAVFVRIQGWTAAAGSQAYLKVYASTNNEYMWTGSSWSNTTTYASSNQPVITVDVSGNWSGWIYAKHNTTLGSTASVRAAKVGATSTNLTSSSKAFTILNMQGAGNGGWIVRNSSPAANKSILAYAGGAVAGTYRTEDNAIVEGYAYSAGGFKIAVPAGIVDSLVTMNDDGSRDNVFAGPWAVTAGQETDASSSAAGIGRGLVRTSPSVLSAGTAHALTITVHGESPYVITNARVKIPATWSWSHATSDIDPSGAGGAVVTVTGDTIVLAGMTIGATDSVRLTVSNVTPPDTTASFALTAATGTHPDSLFAVSAQPSVFVYGIPIPISLVKANDAIGVPLKNNTLVTVRGVVTVANEFGGPSYIQDYSGGMAVFGSSFSTAVAGGDEVVVSGLVQPFSGLTEIVNPQLHAIVSSGNTVEPMTVTASHIANDGAGGVEVYEGRLVRIDDATILGTGAWSANTNYTVYDLTDSTQIRIDNNTNLVGGAIPASSCNIIGVIGQFVSPAPFIGGYQLMPRSTADLLSVGPVIASVPVEGNILPTSFEISWRTSRPGTSALRFGETTAYERGSLAPDTAQRTSHSIVVSGLAPATVYHVQAYSASGGDTSRAGDVVVSTASPAEASGAINVYFNKSVRPSVVTTPPAAGNQDLVALLARRFNNARRSIDAAFYSLSGTPGPGTDLANALIAARARGVRVRVICEQDNRGTAPLSSLVTAGIPLITDTFDPVNAGAGLMHNKFAVIDGRGGAPESVWVWTGSWNPTATGTYDDYQNAVEIQDPALAGAYTLEFNEMWGGSSDIPEATASRFGARKRDNTPHRFRIGQRDVECYFSPSDRTTSRIVAAVDSSRHSIHIALLTLTRDDIAKALLGRKSAGAAIRGVMDNRDDSGSEYDYLLGQGVDLHLKTGPGYFHHKYAILDAGWSDARPTVITGSHNWSSSAENANNENTLIIHDAALADQYLQEFAARYYQFGGTDSIKVSVETEETTSPSSFALLPNYPNPFNPSTTIGYTIAGTGHEATGTRWVRLAVYDVLGREVALLVNEKRPPGSFSVRFDARSLASGIYFARLESGTVNLVRPMLLLR
jgi:phosphatidylserine/phosphatidylglycerophosphate/cardiolipin synthase-like enzyme